MLSDTIDPSRITIVAPQTAEEIHALAAEIVAIAKRFDEADPQPDNYYAAFVDWLATAPQVLTLVRVDGKPAAWIRIDSHKDNPAEVGRKCLEFSGAILPEYLGQGLAEMVSPLAIKAAVARTGKRKIVAITDGHNPAAGASLQRIGFDYRDTTADGSRIYRMMVS